MAERRREGIWIGKVWRSDEHWIIHDGALTTTSEVKLLPEEDSWSKADIEAVKITPWDLKGNDGEEVVVIPATMLPEAPRPLPGLPRGAKIGKLDIKKFGYTSGCLKCEKM